MPIFFPFFFYPPFFLSQETERERGMSKRGGIKFLTKLVAVNIKYNNTPLTFLSWFWSWHLNELRTEGVNALKHAIIQRASLQDLQYAIFFLYKIDSGVDRSTLQKEVRGEKRNSITNQKKCQSRGQRDMETEKIDFQVLSWKCLDFEESPTSPDKSVFVRRHWGEGRRAWET